MPLYRCNWPNGETSFVLAGDEQDAIAKLDEFDAATPEMLRPRHRLHDLDRAHAR